MVFLITAFSSICTLCGVYDSWCIHAFHGGHLRTLGSRGLGKLQAGVKIHNFWMCVLYGWPRVSRTHLTLMIDYGAGWCFTWMYFTFLLRDVIFELTIFEHMYFMNAPFWCVWLLMMCPWCLTLIYHILWVTQADMQGDFEKKIAIQNQPFSSRSTLWTAPRVKGAFDSNDVCIAYLLLWCRMVFYLNNGAKMFLIWLFWEFVLYERPLFCVWLVTCVLIAIAICI